MSKGNQNVPISGPLNNGSQQGAHNDGVHKMKITELAYTGTPVTDMARARAFYEGVLGLKPTMESDGGLWIEYDIGQGTFGIGCFGEMWKPSSDGTCVAFEVEDFDEELAQLQVMNVPFARGVTETHICRFAIICDPDGNRILIHKRKS